MERTAVALGLFDGVHLGHRAVLHAAYKQKENGLKPAVYTFCDDLVSHKGAGGWLYGPEHQQHLFESCGISLVHHARFETICNLSGETFAEQILHKEMHAAYVSCGRNFRFGRGAAWDAENLRQFGQKYGFAVEIMEDVQIDGMTVSSTEIRRLLTEGDIDRANLLLGEPYYILEKVQHGAELGRTIGFPTVNQPFYKGQLVPKYGVYASETLTPDGHWYKSLTNIGMKPTVDYQGLPLAETYIDGFSGDLYGKTVQVVLLSFLREERRFASVSLLMQQMQQDLHKSVQLSEKYHHSNT